MSIPASSAQLIGVEQLADFLHKTEFGNNRLWTVGGNLLGVFAPDTSNDNIRIALACGMSNGRNGRLGTMVDSITSDATNDGALGAIFFVPLYLNNTFATKGSFQGIWNQAVVNEGPANDVYNEAVLYFGTITANRRGALVEGLELGLEVKAGKPSRASVSTLSLVEGNDLADYATFLGVDSIFAETGSMALRIVSQGSKPGGTGIDLRGNLLQGIRFVPDVGGRSFLSMRLQADAYEKFKVGGDAVIRFGGGAGAPDGGFGRLAADVLGTSAGDKLVANAGLGVGNAAAATVPNAVIYKSEVFDAAGNHLGWLPIYDVIA